MITLQTPLREHNPLSKVKTFCFKSSKYQLTRSRKGSGLDGVVEGATEFLLVRTVARNEVCDEFYGTTLQYRKVPLVQVNALHDRIFIKFEYKVQNIITMSMKLLFSFLRLLSLSSWKKNSNKNKTATSGNMAEGREHRLPSKGDQKDLFWGSFNRSLT